MECSNGRVIHHLSRTVFYRTWVNMIGRCYKPHYQKYHNYGGRGITVCDRWLNSFELFYADVKDNYKDGLTIDRIDNEKGYYPENVRWATKLEQMGNRRNTRIVEYNGVKYNFHDICSTLKMIDVDKWVIIYRMKRGLSFQEAISMKKGDKIKNPKPIIRTEEQRLKGNAYMRKQRAEGKNKKKKRII